MLVRPTAVRDLLAAAQFGSCCSAVREVGGSLDRHRYKHDRCARPARGRRRGEARRRRRRLPDERRELPQAALLFPDATCDDPWHADRDYRLTVLTMQGLVEAAPPGQPARGVGPTTSRSAWSCSTGRPG
ncbi:hypothetical protein HBB16_05705 [Pseudonocardia sp. MCCB 268]|nr:hypothetical protein [Pseudonocardia cytotoxica]